MTWAFVVAYILPQYGVHEYITYLGRYLITYTTLHINEQSIP